MAILNRQTAGTKIWQSTNKLSTVYMSCMSFKFIFNQIEQGCFLSMANTLVLSLMKSLSVQIKTGGIFHQGGHLTNEFSSIIKIRY